MSIPSKKLNFTGSGNQQLSGWLDLPQQGNTDRIAIFAHCFTCSKDSIAAKRIAAALAQRGIAVFRFDFTGLGESEGKFADTNFSSNVADIIAANEYLAAQYSVPQMLLGHSFGGAAVVAAADQLPAVTAVVTIAAPASPQHVQHLFSRDLATIRRQGQAEVNLAGRKFIIKDQFLSDIATNSLSRILNRWDKALLILHAPEDELVGIDNAADIYKWAQHPKSFISLTGINHLITRAADAAYIAELVSGWSSRYLPATAATAAKRPAAGTVRVSEQGSGKFLQQIYSNTNAWQADEPTNVGGNDVAPGPYELLLSGLGACTNMTLRMYAERKGWQLGKISVDLSYQRNHAADCAATAGGSNSRKVITEHLIYRHISIAGLADAAVIAQLQQIADKCPVHKTITAGPKIITTLN